MSKLVSKAISKSTSKSMLKFTSLNVKGNVKIQSCQHMPKFNDKKKKKVKSDGKVKINIKLNVCQKQYQRQLM
jgi:hypothetical protein